MKNQNNENRELLEERYALALSRIKEIAGEQVSGCADAEKPGNGEKELTDGRFGRYFGSVAEFLLLMDGEWTFLESGEMLRISPQELAERNQALYRDILPQNYGRSWANPEYAVSVLGEKLGALLSFLYFEMRSLIPFVYEGRLEEIVIRLELFLEVYGSFVTQRQESGLEPEAGTVRDILYWFAFDYADMAAMRKVRQLVDPDVSFAAELLETADFGDESYLYRYGEYVTENELETARFLASLPEETIRLMADTYTEGYRMGFVLGGKDISVKSTVEIRYTLGFERVVRRAVENFAAMGLRPVISRPGASILYDPSPDKIGFLGANPNRQYDFDHKEDRALFLDRAYVTRRAEVLRTAFEEFREMAAGYAGPAVMETFGERDFEPVNKPGALRLSGAQQKLWVELRTKAGEIRRQYILEKERSFTIIAFPVPEIGERFPEIFREVIRINTLDYTLYRDIQQTMIDALDRAEYCEIRGMNGNRTDLRVSLYRLKNPGKETIFENCVADVNIPVGEVFTSPVLAGTTGTLHVRKVFLNGLEYRDLFIRFEDGMIRDYGCSNFDTEEENKAFVKENILYFHDTLPLGEFAIGTNTTAYVAARKYGIEAKMPILIAEKTGPHFAVGDTCYSHSEEVAVFNPDGKEIVARDNEVSLLRESDPDKAYFNCHTDITIPYDELGELTAVTAEGERIPVIAGGIFVLPGCGELNRPLKAGVGA